MILDSLEHALETFPADCYDISGSEVVDNTGNPYISVDNKVSIRFYQSVRMYLANPYPPIYRYATGYDYYFVSLLTSPRNPTFFRVIPIDLQDGVVFTGAPSNIINVMPTIISLQFY